MSEKDYVVTYVYEGEIYVTAESAEEALESAKCTLEEQHGNNISEWSEFTIEEVKE